MAGIGAVMKSHPLSSLIVVACDMPDISSDSIEWLLLQRRPGKVAVIPRSRVTGGSEPLFAWYDFRSAVLISELIAEGLFGLHKICRFERVLEPEIPEKLCRAWRNVNYPEDLG